MRNSPDPLSTAATDVVSRRLVVLIPGLGSHSRKWVSLREKLEQEAGYRPAEADWLLFDHGIKPWSLAQLDDLARRLRNRIDGEWKEHRGYEDVVLIGHSFGGLIARRVYLLAAGAVPNQPDSPWGERVSRIVLFASVNRGFKLERLSWRANVAAWLARSFSRRIFAFEEVLQGSDFVTNLRIDWIRHFSAMQDQARESVAPLVVQFLGDQDGVMSREDSKDVLAFPNGHYIEVADATHSNLYRLDIAPDRAARYAVLREAFVEDPAAMSTDPILRPTPSRIKQVVMILHGIRASNVDAWIDGLKSKLRERDQVETRIVAPTYGYFSALRFGIPLVRRKNIPLFRDAYTEQLAQNPRAEFNIIAHSNGTYMLGHSLEKTPGMRFQNVILAGSALPQSYDWWKLMNPDTANARQVGRVLNERANHDWPVALLCSTLRGLGMQDVGPAGFAGFLGGSTFEVAYHNGGHGQALVPKNHDRLINFIVGGEPPYPPDLVEKPFFFGLLSRLAPYLGLPLVLTFLLLIYIISFPGGVFRPVKAIRTVIGTLIVLALLDSF
jgi:pimeloyl-ACP methyl ester carboxylesterase